MTKRIKKVDELIKRELSQLFLREIEFPEGVIVTITRVEASSNLIQAKAYISILPEAKTRRVLAILNKIIYGIQKKINKKLRMRPVPKIIFVAEKKTEEAARIEEILEELKKEE